jgi:hypothetical protein
MTPLDHTGHQQEDRMTHHDHHRRRSLFGGLGRKLLLGGLG